MSIESAWMDVLESVAATCKAAGRDPAEVTVVAVSKTHPTARIRDAFAAGARDFGENRAQELHAKAPELEDLDLRWHMVGHLQSNKVKHVLPWVSLIHSVDRESLAQELERRANERTAPVPVLLQVNTTGEEAKSGVDPMKLGALVEAVAPLQHLRVDGLMTMGPLGGSESENRAAFAMLRDLRDQLETRFPVKLPILSMGMSGDFREAILEGSTLVRIGTAIFGEREINEIDRG